MNTSLALFFNLIRQYVHVAWTALNDLFFCWRIVQAQSFWAEDEDVQRFRCGRRRWDRKARQGEGYSLRRTAAVSVEPRPLDCGA
jgi:hypothetical protein